MWKELEGAFAVEVSHESRVSSKKEVMAQAVGEDPVAQYLIDTGRVLRERPDGRLFIECPWHEEHTEGVGDDSSTAYWPAHTGGYAQGHFKCLHASHAGKTRGDFLDAIGYLGHEADQEFGVLPGDVPHTDGEPITDVDGMFSDFVLREEEVNEMEEAEFLIPNMIVRGHVTAYVAAANGGKTTIFIHLCEQLTAKGLNVMYINADGSPGDLKRHFEHAQKHDYKVLSPDARRGGSAAAVVQTFQKIARKGADLGDYVFIFDTLKKFTDVINKRQAKEFYTLLRKLSVMGATICLLGHTNKYAGADGEAIFEGTGDLRTDVDDLIYLDNMKNEALGRLEVTTRPNKVRATFEKRSFF